MSEAITEEQEVLLDELDNAAHNLALAALDAAEVGVDTESITSRVEKELGAAGSPITKVVAEAENGLRPASSVYPTEQSQAIVIDRLLSNASILPGLTTKRGRIHVLNRMLDFDTVLSQKIGDVRSFEDKSDIYYAGLIKKMRLRKIASGGRIH